MSEPELESMINPETDVEAEEGAKRRGRVSAFPEEIAAEAQKVYRKVYNKQFKANQTILKSGGDVEVTAKEAAIVAKNEYLVEQGYEPLSKNVNRKDPEAEAEEETEA